MDAVLPRRVAQHPHGEARAGAPFGGQLSSQEGDRPIGGGEIGGGVRRGQVNEGGTAVALWSRGSSSTG